MRLPTVAAVALLTACVNMQVTELGPRVTRPSLEPTQVAIYRAADQVPAAYDEVALIKIKGPHQLSDELMHREMREQAAKLGANGIILQGVVEPSSAKKTGAMYAPGFVDADRVGTAIAIFIK
jgi:hypothetical protein